jgi:hypothetical protein
MTRHIPPSSQENDQRGAVMIPVPVILPRWKRTLRDLIVVIIFLALVSLCIPVRSQAAEFDVWWKMPGDRYWQQCTSISTEKGIAPLDRPIPPGAVIALRDKARGILVPITARRVVAHE